MSLKVSLNFFTPRKFHEILHLYRRLRQTVMRDYRSYQVNACQGTRNSMTHFTAVAANGICETPLLQMLLLWQKLGLQCNSISGHHALLATARPSSMQSDSAIATGCGLQSIDIIKSKSDYWRDIEVEAAGLDSTQKYSEELFIPPPTAVAGGIIFYCWSFFLFLFFLSPQDLRDGSTNREPF